MYSLFILRHGLVPSMVESLSDPDVGPKLLPSVSLLVPPEPWGQGWCGGRETGSLRVAGVGAAVQRESRIAVDGKCGAHPVAVCPLVRYWVVKRICTSPLQAWDLGPTVSSGSDLMM